MLEGQKGVSGIFFGLEITELYYKYDVTVQVAVHYGAFNVSLKIVNRGFKVCYFQ